MADQTISARVLGQGGLSVSSIGLGCMGMSEFHDPKRMDDVGSIRVIRRYLDAGGNFLDTADMDGRGRNEVPVGRAIDELAGIAAILPSGSTAGERHAAQAMQFVNL